MNQPFDRDARMGCLWYTIIGLCAGWLAGQLTRGRGFGLPTNLIVGIIGAIVGGYLFGLFGLQSRSKLGNLVMATVGALVLLAILRILKR